MFRANVGLVVVFVLALVMGVLAGCQPDMMPQQIVTPNAPRLTITINVGSVDHAASTIYGDALGGIETVVVSPSTAIVSDAGVAVPLEAIHTGMTIQIEGSSDSESRVYATHIIILSALPAPFSATVASQ